MNAPADTKHHRTPVGQALHVHGEAVDHVEALYLQAHGEVTDETEEAEAARDLSARDALEQVARYLRYLGDQRKALIRERERLDDLEARLDKRQAWAEGHAVALAEQVAPGRSKATAGTFTVGLRRTVAVATDERLDLATVPPAWVREIPEKVTPASRALDKNAARLDLLLGWQEGPPPHAGWYEVEGHGRVWLEPDNGTPPAWYLAVPDHPTHALDDYDLSIDPVPGRDLLRWRHAPPGVALEHRTHVTVK